MDETRLHGLGRLGFNRISLGVQDLDRNVQEAVNRIQDPTHTLALVAQARDAGFESVSLDLIYGLPKQRRDSFERTLEQILTARPDRLSIYNYAHLPQLFRAQRLIHEEDLPTPAERLALLQGATDRLTDAGYVYIGMDHFALPDDELVRARSAGTLQRNFQGYSTHGGCDLVGLGVSAIGRIGDCYAQNHKDLRHWREALAAGRLPVWRGVQLNREDRLRRAVIESIMCTGGISVERFERAWDLDFEEHFAPEFEALRALEDDGLLQLTDQGPAATGQGLLLLRVIAMVFDESLQAHGAQGAYSRVI